MKRFLLVAGFFALASGLVASLPAEAASKKARVPASRAGGYSYQAADTINTYGDSRTKYGGATSLRDPSLDKQTVAGPFDHGFFFDSATSPRGGDAPYPN